MTRGEPEIEPLAYENINPSGKSGHIDQFSIIPPDIFVVIGEIGMPRVKIALVFEMVKFDTSSLIVIVIVVLSLPPLLLA